MSSFGKIFRLTTFGESHSPAIGGIVEGIPSCFQLDEAYIQKMLNRRKPGQSTLTTKRNESDTVRLLSGIENGLTLGTPIGFLIPNQDVIKTDYNQFNVVPRPGHADMTYLLKYGIKAESGGGRASARETACRVVGGAIAENYLNVHIGTFILSWVSSIGDIEVPKEFNDYLIAEDDGTLDKWKLDMMGSFEVYEQIMGSLDEEEVTLYRNLNSKRLYSSKGELIQDFKDEPQTKRIFVGSSQFELTETLNVRCPHESTAVRMIELIKKTRAEKDSIGGCITCVCKRVPPGLGEPCFDKVQALLAHAMLSIPATKGFEIGSGFSGTKMKGSEHNDPFVKKIPKKDMEENNSAQKQMLIKPKSNNAGGILGGISNGENIYFKVAFKPVSTIGKQQKTVDLVGNECLLEEKGRHDPCVLPRASPIVEAMAAMVLMDCLLQQNATHKMCMAVHDYQI